jgi:hypothetical protein
MQTESTQRVELESRIMEYHGASIEDVLDTISYLRDSGDSVIAGGSLPFRLGNHLSDLDIVITGAGIQTSTVPLEHFVRSLRVDVWKFDHGMIRKVFDRARAALSSTASLRGSFGDVDHETDLKLLHRIAFGITLDGPGLETPADRDYCSIACDLVVREYAERMRDSALVAQLAINAEDFITAAINARLAVEAALNAVVAARSVPFTGDKWLRERLDQEAKDIAPVYTPFAVLPDLLDAEVPSFVERAITACEHLLGMGLGVHTLSRNVGWQSAGLDTKQVGDTHFLVSKQCGGLWELDDVEADVWRRLAETVTDEHTQPRLWAFDECDGIQMTLCLRLYGQGLVDLCWTRGVAVDELTIGVRAGT